MGKQELLDKYKEYRTSCLIHTRCMGYYRPVSSMNTGKQSEFKQRVFYKVKHKNSK